MIVKDHLDLSRTPHPFLDGVMLRHIRDLKGKRIEDLNLRIFEVQPGTENPLHAHSYSHDLFVIQGEGIVRLETTDENIRAGDLVTIRPNEAHSFANVSDDLLQFICIDYRIMDG
jgi:quercetin dioxygenase-like cupin family protein